MLCSRRLRRGVGLHYAWLSRRRRSDVTTLLRGCLRLLKRDQWHLSPFVGALLPGAGGLVGNLYQCEGAGVHHALCCELFHQNYADEPLKCSRNRSLPSYWLTPVSVGHLLGLVHGCTPEDWKEALAALRDARILPSNNETGVSLTRFYKLLSFVAQADASDELAPLECSGTAIMMHFLWLKASSTHDTVTSVNPQC